jgi:hypothetical protein
MLVVRSLPTANLQITEADGGTDFHRETLHALVDRAHEGRHIVVGNYTPGSHQIPS